MSLRINRGFKGGKQPHLQGFFALRKYTLLQFLFLNKIPKIPEKINLSLNNLCLQDNYRIITRKLQD